jgi:nucleotide-binding universal stress UspA family protein
MKKIIAAIDGLKYSESTVQYAVQLSRQSNAHLVGVFLDDFTYHSYKIYDLVSEGIPEHKLKILEDSDKETRRQSVQKFEMACQEAGLTYSVHHDRSVALQDLLHESIYADLLVIYAGETLTHYDEPAPSRFIRDVLAEAKCAVLVVPEDFEPVDHLILLYDGTPVSVYAARMFSYVFTHLSYLDTEVVSVKSPNEDLHLQDSRLLKEFMKRHYPKARYTVMQGTPEAEIIRHSKEHGKGAIVVLGAYQRGMVSRWLKLSMADVLIQQLEVPVFVAHN